MAMTALATSHKVNRGPKRVVGVRALKEEASALVAEVERGSWFVLSKRGNVVGVVLPFAMAEGLVTERAAEIIALQRQRPHPTGE
jgi:antitoxin (DNA-binding transcriptional repressor) of toxin-antitoxin stability system